MHKQKPRFARTNIISFSEHKLRRDQSEALKFRYISASIAQPILNAVYEEARSAGIGCSFEAETQNHPADYDLVYAMRLGPHRIDLAFTPERAIVTSRPFAAAEDKSFARKAMRGAKAKLAGTLDIPCSEQNWTALLQDHVIARTRALLCPAEI